MRDLVHDRFQDAFVAAIAGDDAALAGWWPADQAIQGRSGLGVYRNTIALGLADSLAASYPTVVTVVGEDWMREAAILFARDHPPADAVLLAYGGDFPDWLEAFAPAADMPYLADIARIDRLWTEAHIAADADMMAPHAIASLAPEDFDTVRLALLPSVRLARFGTGIADLWRALRSDAPDAIDLAPEPQAIVLWRPGGEVQSRTIGDGAFAFLGTCADRGSVAAAALAAVSAAPDADLSVLFADLIAAGVFTGILSLASEGSPT